MIQLFLTLLLLIILIIIINTKESFYQVSCPTNKFILTAMNSYDEQVDKKVPCIKLIMETDITGKSGYILIKNKNENISNIIKLSTSNLKQSEDDKGKKYINLTEENSTIQLDKTYLITLNIINDDTNIVDVYNTIEITFREVNLSPSDLTTKYKCNTDKLIKSLKNKNIVFHL